jgi:hypothetical protein
MVQGMLVAVLAWHMEGPPAQAMLDVRPAVNMVQMGPQAAVGAQAGHKWGGETRFAVDRSEGIFVQEAPGYFHMAHF